MRGVIGMRGIIGSMAAGLLGLAILATSGCGPTAYAEGLYYSVTYDDVVLVKANNTLYKRRSRDGLFMNPSLAKQMAGHVIPSNPNIEIFPNYMTAYEQLKARKVDFKVDLESRPDIPYKTHQRSVGPYGAVDASQPPNLNIPIVTDKGERFNHHLKRSFIERNYFNQDKDLSHQDKSDSNWHPLSHHGDHVVKSSAKADEKDTAKTEKKVTEKKVAEKEATPATKEKKTETKKKADKE